MTSTEPAANNAKTPNFGRRIKWLGVFVAFLMLAWTGGWFYLARLGEEQVDLALANANKGGQNDRLRQPDSQWLPIPLWSVLRFCRRRPVGKGTVRFRGRTADGRAGLQSLASGRRVRWPCNH